MKFYFTFCLALLLHTSIAQSQNSPFINVGEAKISKSPVAILPVKYLGTASISSKSLEHGKKIYNIIKKDLDISSYFQLISEKAFVEAKKHSGLTPKANDPINGFRFEPWKTIGAEFLIKTGFKVAKNKVTLDTYLYHVPRKALIFGKSYTGSTDDLRTIAHSYCDDILKRLTGKKGFFMTKFLVARSTIKNEKEIFVMDWDGSNLKQLTHHRTTSQSPAWSRDGAQMAYTSFLYHKKRKTRNADLILYDFRTRKRFIMSSQQGINSGPSFDPKSDAVFMRISKKGVSDIYKLSNAGKTIKQVTDGPRGAMNVEPAISPDGTKMVFSSDKGGRPMIYLKNLLTGKTRRLTHAGVYNSSPAWSPDGKKITFAGWEKDHFDVFVMNADGSNLERLTTAKKTNGKMSNNEYPSFSPDGRFILFASNRTMNYQLYIVNIDSKDSNRLTFDNKNYYKPQWSPYLN